jgi:hypothetical protein
MPVPRISNSSRPYRKGRPAAPPFAQSAVNGGLQPTEGTTRHPLSIDADTCWATCEKTHNCNRTGDNSGLQLGNHFNAARDNRL